MPFPNHIDGHWSFRGFYNKLEHLHHLPAAYAIKDALASGSVAWSQDPNDRGVVKGGGFVYYATNFDDARVDFHWLEQDVKSLSYGDVRFALESLRTILFL